MKTCNFKKVDTIEGITRTMEVKETVKGYKKSNANNSVIIFKRGKIGYIITINNDNYTFEKFNYSTASYESFDYEDIRKFFDFNN